MHKKKTPTDVKRNEIITCPYFRMTSWDTQKDKKVYDLYCKLDYMIFYTYRAKSDKITDDDKKMMQNCMRQNCASECPKMWNDGIPGEDDEFDAFSQFGDEYYDDPFEEKPTKRTYYPESLTEERDYLLNGWKDEIKKSENLPAKR